MKTFFLTALFALLAAAPVYGLRASSDSLTPGWDAWRQLPLKSLPEIRFRDFQLYSGERFSLRDRISLQFLKFRTRKEIRRHPDMTLGEYLQHKPMNTVGLILVIILILLALGAVLLLRFGLPH